MDSSAQERREAGFFATTLWTVVMQAGEAESARAREALQQLCASYWYPLYAYVRRQGHTPEDAQDLTQEFFARLLERNSLCRADRNRGRFRTFLLTLLKHFLINEWTKANREKRGGGCQIVPLNTEQTETRLQMEPPDGARTPDKAFDRRWALVLLDKTLERLEAEFVKDGRGALFKELRPLLTGDEEASSYAQLSRSVGMTESNLKVTVHRLRKRYRELLRGEIAATVEDPVAVDDEMSDLMAALTD